LEKPSDKNGERLRRQDLDWLTRHYLNEAADLDYSAKEVNQVLKNHMSLWVETGSPPAEHKN